MYMHEYRNCDVFKMYFIFECYKMYLSSQKFLYIIVTSIYDQTMPELVFLNVYGAPESIPRNEFRQPM